MGILDDDEEIEVIGQPKLPENYRKDEFWIENERRGKRILVKLCFNLDVRGSFFLDSQEELMSWLVTMEILNSELKARTKKVYSNQSNS